MGHNFPRVPWCTLTQKSFAISGHSLTKITLLWDSNHRFSGHTCSVSTGESLSCPCLNQQETWPNWTIQSCPCKVYLELFNTIVELKLETKAVFLPSVNGSASLMLLLTVRKSSYLPSTDSLYITAINSRKCPEIDEDKGHSLSAEHGQYQHQQSLNKILPGWLLLPRQDGR